MFLKFTRYDSLVFLALTVFSFYVVSLYNFLVDNATNRCQMTYIYELPQYVKINMSDHVGKIYRRYALYAYSEGKFIERARAMKFTGIPVLFVPGHGGSFKQVRSLASVTTFRTLDLQSIFHFDFFTIDFNGELSALYGGTLMDQHEFMISCVKRILELYPPKNRPKSVVIIGHSMGGMIARSMFTNPSFDPSTVKLIITLATPHQPVILIDRNLKDFYDSVDTFWQRQRATKNNRLENLTMISVGGGIKDVLVRPELTFNELADLNILTNNIPGVITSMDHLCIVWCNNFIKTLSRTLYDAVDFDVKGITQNRKHLRSVFYYHMVHCSNGKYYTSDMHREKLKFMKNSVWKELNKNFTSFLAPHGLEQDMHLLIKKPTDLDEYDSIMIEVINVDKRDWVAECHAQRDNRLIYCEEGDNLSKYGIIGFNKTYRRKYFRSRLESRIFRRHLQYLIVKLPATEERTGLNVELYKEKTRTSYVNMESSFFFERKTVIEETQPKALFYTIRLINLTTVWQVYHLHLIPLGCMKEKHLAFAVFRTPWNHDSSHVKVNWKEKQILKIILLTIPSPRRKGLPFVELILDPSCTYKVQIEGSFLDSLGVIAIRYALTFVANLGALLLLILSSQHWSLARRKCCPSFLEALQKTKGPYLAYPLVKLMTYLWSSFNLDERFFKLDSQELNDDAWDQLIISVLIYLISLAILYIVGTALHFSILLYVHIYQRYSIGEWISRYSFLRDPNVYDMVGMFLPVSLATVIMSVGCITCGGHGLITGTMFYYANICSLYKSYVEHEKSLKKDNENKALEEEDKTGAENHQQNYVEFISDDVNKPKIDSVHLHSTLFLLWCLCTVTYLPSSIMWHKNMEFGSLFKNNNFCVLFSYSCAVGVLWHCNIPYIFIRYYRVNCYLLFTIACAILLSCQVNIYRLPTLLTPVFILVAAHQYYGLRVLKSSSILKDDKKASTKMKEN